MFNKKVGRMAAMTLAAVMMFSTTGCGKEKKEETFRDPYEGTVDISTEEMLSTLRDGYWIGGMIDGEMLLFTENEIVMCNIGDSKVFRYDSRKLEQISEDDYAPAAFGRKPPLSQNLGIPADELMLEPHLARGYYKKGDV